MMAVRVIVDPSSSAGASNGHKGLLTAIDVQLYYSELVQSAMVGNYINF